MVRSIAIKNTRIKVNKHWTLDIFFLGFDSTCDLSAVLGILERASIFHPRIQTNAKDVRAEIRNEWGHCNFDLWTDAKFINSFQLMETLLRSLGLPKADIDKHLDELREWETKGKSKALTHTNKTKPEKSSNFPSYF